MGVSTRAAYSAGTEEVPSKLSSEDQDFGSNPSEVLKAKSECADDKCAKSAVESVRSSLAWWQRRAKEHSVEALPITVELLQLLGLC